MADSDDIGDKEPNSNGIVDGNDEESYFKWTHQEEATLYTVLHSVMTHICFPDPDSSYAASTVFHCIKASLSENVPLLREASQNTGRNVLLWTRQGSPLRALLVVSVGTISLVALTGLLVFMLFFLAATINAIIISFLISLAVVGGFLALFLSCVTAIYIGALSVAVFVISTATISAMVAVVIATGWIGFFWTVWLATKKSMDIAKHSLSTTSSALSAYSSARHGRHRHQPTKSD